MAEKALEAPAVRFWRFQLEEARTAHKAERRKMMTTGASLVALERHSKRIDKALRELRKLGADVGRSPEDSR